MQRLANPIWLSLDLREKCICSDSLLFCFTAGFNYKGFVTESTSFRHFGSVVQSPSQQEMASLGHIVDGLHCFIYFYIFVLVLSANQHLNIFRSEFRGLSQYKLTAVTGNLYLFPTFGKILSTKFSNFEVLE